ncbi:hypothetical protein [Pseudoclavibacter sp. 13-3]|uniref:hypothetical protein n=1 Tax=Pseudoclavibacter sp. 13-3 TaxID=2901228 RepID=UPI001E5DCF92|nr:hypothetical protein [Pseudoclavibacter sp. 13-3]MCD7101828.1 hypothetical protein [Pseudoclavibacter sp. 13-3]
MSMTGEHLAEFAIRPPTWTRWIAAAPLIFVAAALIIVAMTLDGGAIGLMVSVAVVVALGLVTWWWLRWTVIRVRIQPHEVRLAAPFYRASVHIADISQTAVVDDATLDRSGFDWVVMGRPRDRSGVRLNLGGVAALQMQTFDQRLYTVVFTSFDDAEHAQRVIDRHRFGG